MSNLDLLRRLGIFVEESFLPPDACRVVIEESESTRWKPATVHGAHRVVDESLRRTSKSRLPSASAATLEEALAGVTPALERHFATSLASYEDPQLLRYGAEDFFTVHQDAGTDDISGRRRVSVTLFLNDGTDGEGLPGYLGGSLVFYGLLGHAHRGAPVGIPVHPRAGMLVAFPSTTMHEVEAVEQGLRYSIVTWFSG